MLNLIITSILFCTDKHKLDLQKIRTENYQKNKNLEPKNYRP